MNEVCPFCGEFVKRLHELTGWCAACTHQEGRKCLACGEPKPLEAFSRDRSRKDGLRPVCRPCDAQASRERQAKKRLSHRPSPIEQTA